MTHIVRTEQEMIALGERLGAALRPPTTIELIGDVGAGKTTITKGIALAIGISDPITSPSFTLQKTYSAPNHSVLLAHYDFYRLPDPGIMAEDLAESIADSSTITIVEWATTVADVLPADHTTITISCQDDGTRAVEVIGREKETPSTAE